MQNALKTIWVLTSQYEKPIFLVLQQRREIDEEPVVWLGLEKPIFLVLPPSDPMQLGKNLRRRLELFSSA